MGQMKKELFMLMPLEMSGECFTSNLGEALREEVPLIELT